AADPGAAPRGSCPRGGGLGIIMATIPAGCISQAWPERMIWLQWILIVAYWVPGSYGYCWGCCQGRNEMPQNRRSKVPQKRRFEKSPASVVLLHRGRRGKMTEHAGFQFLLQA